MRRIPHSLVVHLVVELLNNIWHNLLLLFVRLSLQLGRLCLRLGILCLQLVKNLLLAILLLLLWWLSDPLKLGPDLIGYSWLLHDLDLGLDLEQGAHPPLLLAHKGH